jgi:hypothetical protein
MKIKIGIDISRQNDITVYAIRKPDGTLEVLSDNVVVRRDAENYLRISNDTHTRTKKRNA